MDREDLLIVGAGPAGLALSYAWREGSRILEQAREVGGLCRTIEFGGGVFDIGGHSFHSPHPQVQALVEDLMAGRWHTQRRDARVYFQGELIDYPFQRHFDQISDPAIVAECRRSLPRAGATDAPNNFEDWIVARFGEGIARHFMLPYNRKLWARDLRRMSCEWVNERIVGGEVSAGGAGVQNRRPLVEQSQVGYPAEGGFGEIFQAMAKHCGPIEFGQEVLHIDPLRRTAQTSSGEIWAWTRLVSTMPLPALLRTINGCPSDLIADAERLEFVSLKVLLILVAKPLGGQPQRVYLADPQVPAHKIAFNHTSSPHLRRRPAHAIICEISHSPEKPPGSDADIADSMVQWLADCGLIDAREDVVETRIVDVEYGYPVYTPERAAIVEKARAYLAQFDIHTIGRLGGWDYVNSDACIRQGLDLAASLKRRT